MSSPAARTESSRKSAALVWIVVTILLVLHFTLAMTSVANKCNTFDEIAHLTAGYSYWTTNDYRLHPENGNLPQRWAALPLLTLSLEFPSTDLDEWSVSDVWMIGHQFFFELGNEIEFVLWQGRAMIALFSVMLGIVVFLLGKRLFGSVGGLLSLVLYTFSPTMLAHSRLVTSDLAAALFFTLSICMLWLLMHKVTFSTVLGAGCAVSGLMLSKMSGILIVPMVVLLLVVRTIWGRPIEIKLVRTWRICGRLRQTSVLLGIAVTQVLIVLLIIWAFYGFRYSAVNETQPSHRQFYRSWASQLNEVGNLRPAVEWAREHRLLPEAYLYGFTEVVSLSQFRRAFLNGEYSVDGWWYFFPFCLVAKTPLSVFLLLGLSAVTLIIGRPPGILYRAMPFLALLVVYWAFALTSHLNIGHRHLLPTYPAMFVLAGGVTMLRRDHRRSIVGLVVVGLLVFIAESFLIWPDYLAYFNAAAGGPKQGYRRLVDSSLDWGQDLPELRRWLEHQGLADQDDTEVYFSYFGTASPTYYRIQANRLPSCWPFDKTVTHDTPLVPMKGGYYCLSATMLQQICTDAFGKWCKQFEREYWSTMEVARRYTLTENDPESRATLIKKVGSDRFDRILQRFQALRFGRLCAYLRHRAPDAQVGYSILIYRLSDDEIEAALLQPPVELYEDSEVKGVSRFVNS